MTLWRYKAVDARRGSAEVAVTTSGELAAASAAEVRASLRRIGLQVIDVRPVRSSAISARFLQDGTLLRPLRLAWHRHQQRRRKMLRAELYDGLATMLDAGLPLLEAVETLTGETPEDQGRRPQVFGLRIDSRRTMLMEVREALRSGRSLEEAFHEHGGWFDEAELAMIRAGQHNGDLAGVLRNLTDRHQRSGELGQKVTGALAYPAIIAMVGLGVVIFLSVKTLPDLVGILEQAEVAVPALTERVMAVGQFLYRGWWLVTGGLALALVLAIVLPSFLDRFSSHLDSRDAGRAPVRHRRWTVVPKVLRRVGVANISLRLSELIRTGVPMVEALRVLAPTARLPGTGHRLTRLLHQAADRVERGDDLAAAFDDPCWFEREYCRLLTIGQSTGELHELLDRIGRRYQRQAERLIDRLAALLEPAVLLALAVLIGIVVMAAILPLIRLQEVLG